MLIGKIIPTSTTDKITSPKKLLFKKTLQKTYVVARQCVLQNSIRQKKKEKTSMMSALMTIIANMITVDKVSKVHEELLYF